MPKETPAAVSKYLAAIGRRGGEAKGKPKGLATMSKAKKRVIAMAGVAARRKKAAAE